jgi:hypothetical protein
LRQTSFFPSLGNHERNTKDFYEFFQTELPYYPSIGATHILPDQQRHSQISTSKLARRILDRQTRCWKRISPPAKSPLPFVPGSPPPFISDPQGQPAHDRAHLMPKASVTAGFFGHDHNYQHYLKNGVHYVISGGGGAPLYDVNKPDPAITQKVVSIENFVSVSVNGKVASVKAISIDGKILDQFELRSSIQ